MQIHYFVINAANIPKRVNFVFDLQIREKSFFCFFITEKIVINKY